MTDRESHYKETLFKTKEQPVATLEEPVLKPCPFCGNKNLKLERLHKQKYLGQGNVADIWGIACHGTQPDGKPCYVELVPGQLEAVVSRWNTRV